MAIQLTPSEWDRKWWEAYHTRISHNDQHAFDGAHKYMLNNWGSRPDEAKSGMPSKFTLIKLAYRLYRRRNLMNLSNVFKGIAAFFGAVAAQVGAVGVPTNRQGWIPILVAGLTTAAGSVFITPSKTEAKSE